MKSSNCNYLKILSLFVVTLSAVSNSSFAEVYGSPDEDPVVASLRARFEKASLPKVEALVKGTYFCVIKIAVNSNYGKETDRMSFESFDSLIIDRGGRVYAQSEKEYVSAFYSQGSYTPFYFAIREETSGTLLIENSIMTTFASSMHKTDPVAAVKGKLNDYRLCILEKN